MNISIASIKGRRCYQEDRIGVLELLVGAKRVLIAAVADGAGGMGAGDVAARLGLQTCLRSIVHSLLLADHDPNVHEVSEAVERAIQHANDTVRCGQRNDPQCAQMCSTLSAIVLFDEWLIAAWLGDSPILAWDGGTVRQISVPQTYAEDCAIAGDINRGGTLYHQHSHIITGGLGLTDLVIPRVRVLRISADERVIVASDGVESLKLKQLEQAMRETAALPFDEAAESIAQDALAAGSTDNISVVIARPIRSDAKPAPQVTVSLDYARELARRTHPNQGELR